MSSFHLSGRNLNRGSFAMHPNQSVTPPRYKMFLLTWLAIYPLITVILWLFGPLLALLPLPLRTLILTGAVVYLMVYIVMPRLTNQFRRWLDHK